MNIQNFLKIKYPILQGAMANISDGKFAATVSNAGALGTIASGGMMPDRLKKEIEIAKDLTDKPFAVNIMMLNPYVEKMVEIIVKEKVPIITIGAGSPAPFMKKFRESDIKVIPLISAPIMAKRLERTGADAIIAEGNEAGGHIGRMTTMTLIHQSFDSIDIPLIAAGGIGSGRQMLATEILGATGVQMGTAFLFTEECPIHKNYKEVILKSSASKITVIGETNSMPIRLLKNNMTKEYRDKEMKGADLFELEKYTLGSLKRAVRDGDIKDGSVMAGLTIGQFDKIIPVKDLLQKIMEEYHEAKSCLLK
ncbi:MAG: nitronate monooxygenase [Tissierellia bacterium]|nr:nitronate monooxygenase [Tissierellia bacterium]